MELKVSSPKQGLSLTDCVSDPDEKEISEDDDDDRNHKHRRREERSQSLEGNAPGHVLTKPHRKRNKPFENGHSFGEGGSQSSETWKNYITNHDKELFGRFERRRPNATSFFRSSNDLNQRMRVNHSISADQGPIRGRGKDPSSWNQRDARFSSGDIASHLLQQGSVPPNLFPGRGLPNVSSLQSASWSAFGLVPAMPNGGLDALHPISLQGSLRPPMNATVNLGIPRQRCRDFEERGFCLRGDMCPMEHGVNRIVVEDVQSLSQFNLPVSLPGAHLLGTPAGQGHLNANTSSSTFTNNKSLHNKSSKPGIPDDGLGLNVGTADLYDPDQPLWTNDCPETSPALLALNPSSIDDTDALLDARPSDRHPFGHCDAFDNERPIKNGGTAVGSQSSSVWGRIGGSKSRPDVREKIDSTLSSSSHLENEIKIDAGSENGAQVVARQGKRMDVDDVGTQVIGLSSKQQNDSGRNARKPSQKALRTLFVNGIPHKENKRETLLLHFQKFGEVIDIYIPLNSERAFVQFSKREEAEAALKSPDAVMGNRFIKLWWANRDSIPDDGVSGICNVPVNPRAVTHSSSGISNPWTTRGKDNAQTSGPKVNVSHASVNSVPASDHPKPIVISGPRAPPPMQKKLEKLALLKEVQKKQEMLAKKRNEFMRQLDKLTKQTNSSKDEVPSDQSSKRHKAETLDVARNEILSSCDSGTVVSPQQAELALDGCRPAESTAPHSSKLNSGAPLQEPSSLKPSIRPLAPISVPFVMNRFKLDNRPTAFKVLPPLPAGFADVSVLKEHFSSYGDLNLVELEGSEHGDSSNGSDAPEISAHISFTTRHAAERAFSSAKFWQGQKLQFKWLAPNVSKINTVKENPAASRKSSDAVNSFSEEVTSTSFQDADASETIESENLEVKKENVDEDDDSKSSSTKISGEKQSP